MGLFGEGELFLKKVENRDFQKILCPKVLAELGSTFSMYNTDRDAMPGTLFEVSICYIKAVIDFQTLSDFATRVFPTFFFLNLKNVPEKVSTCSFQHI